MKKEVELFLKRKNVAFIMKSLKNLRKIIIILDLTVLLNILYFAIITPNSFEFSKIIPNNIKIYNYTIGISNLVYLVIVLIVAVVLGVLYRIDLKKILNK